MKQLLRLSAERPFVFTLAWIGYVMAISFMEAPLKFQAPSLTEPVALEIGHLVFHALNHVEVGLAVVIGAITFLRPAPERIRKLFGAVVVILLVQTVLLYTKLDERTLAIINGEEVPEAPFHLIYIGMEMVKLGMLFCLAHWQINWCVRAWDEM